jgi:hypothetical protein
MTTHIKRPNSYKLHEEIRNHPLYPVVSNSPCLWKRLPPVEEQLLLWASQGKGQIALSKLMGVSQPSICIMRYRAIYRLIGMKDWPDLKNLPEAIRQIPSEYKEQRDVLMAIHVTRTQQGAAGLVGRSQGYVRHIFIGALPRFEEWGLLQWKPYFESIRANPRLFHETR